MKSKPKDRKKQNKRQAEISAIFGPYAKWFIFLRLLIHHKKSQKKKTKPKNANNNTYAHTYTHTREPRSKST